MFTDWPEIRLRNDGSASMLDLRQFYGAKLHAQRFYGFSDQDAASS